MACSPWMPISPNSCSIAPGGRRIFFFQAEDGIRCKLVTGVQTCALPIFYGNTTDKDAHVRQVYLRGGVTGLDGKVSIAAAGEYYSRANLFSRDREISTTGDLSNKIGRASCRERDEITVEQESYLHRSVIV